MHGPAKDIHFAVPPLPVLADAPIWLQPSPYACLHGRIENWRRCTHRQSLRPPRHGDVEVADVEHSGVENHRHFRFHPFR